MMPRLYPGASRRGIDRVQRLWEFVVDLVEREAEGLECDHETRLTLGGVAVCVDMDCPLAWVDRVLQPDWHTALPSAPEAEVKRGE